jgi:hypothetical protein
MRERSPPVKSTLMGLVHLSASPVTLDHDSRTLKSARADPSYLEQGDEGDVTLTPCETPRVTGPQSHGPHDNDLGAHLRSQPRVTGALSSVGARPISRNSSPDRTTEVHQSSPSRHCDRP